MNLIEQLGGYESAKAEYSDPMYEDGELYTIKATGTRFFKHNLAEELLEYRRANNIFEVGDWVFPRAKGSGFRAMQIKKITKTFLYADHLILNVEHWRHATDAEIEAGKRLEVV